MSADVTSSAVDLSKVDGYAVFAKWTGAPVGTIKLEVGLDGQNYVEYPGSATAVNGAGDALWEVTTAFYDKVRVKYERTSGTGSLNVQINGKGDRE